MLRPTPFHPRTSARCASLAWKEWAGYAAVCTYDRHSEREYHALRHAAGLLDVTPLRKLEVRGPDAARLLARTWCRDAERLAVGRVAYAALADPRGRCLDDGTLCRLEEDRFLVTSSEPWFAWHLRMARGLDVSVRDRSHDLAALAVQGPASREVLRQVVDWDLDRMRYFRIRPTRLAGRPGWISRTGYTGDLGFELWMAPDDALVVWDAVVEAGRPHGLEPVGLDALDVARIEAGYVLQGVDYRSARTCLLPDQTSSPDEAGLGWTVDLDRDPFVGQAAIREERERGSRWAMVALELSWEGIEALHERRGLPPRLGPTASRLPVPVYERPGGRQVGHVTSSTWSPLTKRYLALGQVEAALGAEGVRLAVEYTVEFVRETVEATVVPRPPFDPPRRRSVLRRGAPAGLRGAA